jgi:hypothetical protein
VFWELSELGVSYKRGVFETKYLDIR